jgi:ABC-type glutathione transport system ATPase component
MSIARALYSEANILLCDEITSAIDVSSQAQVVEILKKLNAERKLSAIFVSHDIALLSMLCTRIMVMKDGQVVEQGLTADVIGEPKHEYTKLLIESARKQSL